MLKRTALFGQLSAMKCRMSRGYRVLAIESSCDDSSVALLDYNKKNKNTEIISHLKSTLDSSTIGGIIPTAALTHHQQNLPVLIKKIVTQYNKPIDFIAVTRGPGMVGSLSVGLNLAKGLSLGWNVPLIGVNHMLGHLLIPRLYSETATDNKENSLDFPLISLLVSGGHTMLVYSEDILTHKILCDSIDIAIGDSLDKCGRELHIKANMIGKEIEQLASKYNLDSNKILQLPNPLSSPHNKNKLHFSFAPFITSLKDQLKNLLSMENLVQNDSIRNQLAYEIQEAHFNHLIYKVKQTMLNFSTDYNNSIKFVMSGGVSCNDRLRSKLEMELEDYFTSFHYPLRNELCTDNAVMIGWAAIELINHFSHYESCSIHNNLDILPLRKWGLSELTTLSEWIRFRES